MFASDPLKPSPQRIINLKFISSDHEDFVLKSTFQLTSKKSKKISGWGKNHAHFAVELKSRERSSLLRSCCEDQFLFILRMDTSKIATLPSRFFCCAVLPLWLSRMLCLFQRHIHVYHLHQTGESLKTFSTLFWGLLREASVKWGLHIQDNSFLEQLKLVLLQSQMK